MRKGVIYVGLCFCFTAFTLFLIGCRNKNTNKQYNSFSAFYADSVFLRIEGNLNDPNIIWSNKKVFIQAVSRLRNHCYLQDSLIKWDFKNAEEVKISDNIVEYVTRGWTIQNQMVKSGEFEFWNIDGTFVPLRKDKTEHSADAKPMPANTLPKIKINK